MQILKSSCRNKNIEFDKYDQYVCYIVHILNLTVQEVLVVLKASEITDKNELLQDKQDTPEICEIIPKVN
jgi:hypothetical protein